MRGGDVGTALVIGNGAGHFEDAVVGTGREIELGHGLLEQGEGFVVELAVFAEQGRSHHGIAMNQRMTLEAFFLDLTGTDYTLTNLLGRLSHRGLAHFFKAQRNNIYLKIYSV